LNRFKTTTNNFSKENQSMKRFLTTALMAAIVVLPLSAFAGTTWTTGQANNLAAHKLQACGYVGNFCSSEQTALRDQLDSLESQAGGMGLSKTTMNLVNAAADKTVCFTEECEVAEVKNRYTTLLSAAKSINAYHNKPQVKAKPVTATNIEQAKEAFTKAEVAYAKALVALGLQQDAAFEQVLAERNTAHMAAARDNSKAAVLTACEAEPKRCENMEIFGKHVPASFYLAHIGNITGEAGFQIPDEPLKFYHNGEEVNGLGQVIGKTYVPQWTARMYLTGKGIKVLSNESDTEKANFYAVDSNNATLPDSAFVDANGAFCPEQDGYTRDLVAGSLFSSEMLQSVLKVGGYHFTEIAGIRYHKVQDATCVYFVEPKNSEASVNPITFLSQLEDSGIIGVNNISTAELIATLKNEIRTTGRNVDSEYLNADAVGSSFILFDFNGSRHLMMTDYSAAGTEIPSAQLAQNTGLDKFFAFKTIGLKRGEYVMDHALPITITQKIVKEAIPGTPKVVSQIVIPEQTVERMVSGEKGWFSNSVAKTVQETIPATVGTVTTPAVAGIPAVVETIVSVNPVFGTTDK
jgi:hypothetical protein